MGRRKISWSELPSELLSQIGKRLETRLDIFNFRVVCKEWCRSISLVIVSHKNMLSPILPHKFTPLIKGGLHSRLEQFYNEISVNYLILSVSFIFLVKPIDDNVPPWLFTVDEVNPGKLFLRIPFCRSKVKKLPVNFPRNLGLGKFDVLEMGRVYSLRFDEMCYDFPFEGYGKFNDLFEEDHKVVLLGETGLKIEDCIAVVLYDNGTLCVIKLRNERVEVVTGDSSGRKFDDIVVCNGMVYVIDRRGRLYLMDKTSNTDDSFKLFNIIQDSLDGDRKSRLVESCGELYFVLKCIVYKPSFEKMCRGFRVYKLNQEKNTWDEIDSIGNDRILFVTPDCCFFARAADFCGWKGNCIVSHTKNSFSSHARASNDYNECYSDYILERDGDRLSIEVFHFEDFKFTPVQCTPHYSDVFWPPPQWISPDAYSPTVKFQGVYIRVELKPTLETIWAKHGNLIGSDTIRSKTLASALEELAELVINLKYITDRTTLTDSQADDLRSNLLDFQRKGLNVEWLFPVIDKAVMLHKNKSIRESIMGLEKEIAKLDEKKRDILAQRAKLKDELKEDIDPDDFFEKVLW